MGKPRRVRGVVSFAGRFIVFAPLCLVLWWLLLPYYAWCLGLVSSVILKYFLTVPVESFEVANTGLANREGILNTGTQLGFVIDGAPIVMPGLGGIATNVAPFVALVLATATISVRRRGKVILLGAPILICTHVLFIVMAAKTPETKVLHAIGQVFITLPFLLWLVLAYWDRINGYFSDAPSAKKTDVPPSES
ncbi:MAG TPA: hypothetical protein PLO37_11340 [Candidatus Hydrogenedentes bacterium]|nr:hypothetical protein [Candidatus Hydrogenedentota bacterium]